MQAIDAGQTRKAGQVNLVRRFDSRKRTVPEKAAVPAPSA
jgi:hypothetical protein